MRGITGAMILPLIASLALAQTAPAPKSADPVEADWRTIADDDLLVIDLAGDRRVIIRLAPRQAPVHVANIRKLARAHWWDGESVYRVQDNYVVQWGDPTEKKPLPANVVANPPAEVDFAAAATPGRLSRSDPYARVAGFTADGWPQISGAWRSDQATERAWMPHCYAMVGVARDLAPSTGSGGDLYTVIGHAPRHLDRNIALVGRVIEGMEYMASLPRGHADLGLYEDAAMRVPIVRVTLASDLPIADRPHFQYRATENSRFAAYVHERENRDPPFFTVPAGGADICNVPLAVRHKP